MSQISQKSISGITSITTPTGIDNQFTLHINDTSEALKLDHAGNIHIHNHVNTTGISSASNFKTGTSDLHSAGLNVAYADVDDFIDVGSNIKLGNAGVITATSFSGDGSNLTSLPAGLGTALSSTQTDPLNKLYYTNQVLGVGATITVDPPASASKAYTQYADIKVDSDADLIIAEGDDLIPDVLGLADFGNFGGGASAGRIRVNSITNAAANGATTIQNGVVISGMTTITGGLSIGGTITYEDVTNVDSVGLITARNGIDCNGDLDVDGHTELDNVNIVGVTTHNGTTNLYGNGSASVVWGNTGYTGHLSFDGSSNAVIRAASGKALIFQTNHVSERLRITSDGKVSIGGFNPSVAGLSISNSSTNRGFEFDTGSGFDSTSCIRAYDRPTSAYKSLGLTGSDIRFGINDVEKARIDENGNARFGPGGTIGNSTNYTTVVIANTAGGEVQFRDSGNNNHIGGLVGVEGGGMYLSTRQATPIIFRIGTGSGSNTTEKLRIASSGNVSAVGIVTATVCLGAEGTAFKYDTITQISNIDITNSYATTSTYYKWVLPSAGIYMLQSSMRVRMWNTTGYIQCRLYDNTASSSISNSERMMWEQQTSLYTNVNITLSWVINVASGRTIYQQFRTSNQTTGNGIQRDGNGHNYMFWQKLS